MGYPKTAGKNPTIRSGACGRGLQSTRDSLVESNRIELSRDHDGVVVVVVAGEHDVHTAPSLRERIESVIKEQKPFAIDLTPATFIDSSILRVLLEARRRAQEEGLGFAVSLGDEQAAGVRRILEVTGLIPIFPVLGGRAEAVDAARSGRNPS
jgi:anti-sigma B factor antagonist